MAEQLKHYFNTQFFQHLNERLLNAWNGFDESKLLELIHDADWDDRELKDRMHHLAHCLHKVLPGPYSRNCNILCQSISEGFGMQFMSFPDYVEIYGMEDRETSLEALKHMTPFASSEFAIRPFIIQDEKKTMKVLSKWANDKSHDVRRLASEGCRPRLPWAMALPSFKKDPKLVLPILETLKDDETEYVRRSVANNLNDISKDHPNIVLDIAKRWYGKSKNGDRLVKHALRTLLKAGNTDALVLFGFEDPSQISVSNLSVSNAKPRIGEKFEFNFSLNSTEKQMGKLRVEYIVHFMKKNGQLSGKVFQLSEKVHDKQDAAMRKSHSFQELSTRKHYPGTHKLGIVVNGIEKQQIEFELLPA